METQNYTRFAWRKGMVPRRYTPAEKRHLKIIIRDLYARGFTQEGVAKELNTAGKLTANGRQWTGCNVAHFYGKKVKRQPNKPKTIVQEVSRAEIPAGIRYVAVIPAGVKYAVLGALIGAAITFAVRVV